MLLKVILASESVLANFTLPVPAFLFLQFAVFAQGHDSAHVVGHDVVTPCYGVAEGYADILVLTMQGDKL
jgi:hypothetical protein